MAQKFAPKHISGTVVMSVEIVHTNGTILPCSIEQYDANEFMFTITVDGKKLTNYALYTTARRAIGAASRIQY